MRIYKGEVGMELTVQSFLDLLEEDALDEVINAVLDLEAQASLSGDFDGDYQLRVINLDDYDGDISHLFDHIEDNIEHYDILSQDEFYGNGFEYAGLSEEEIMDSLLFSNEDLRLKRIVDRFRHIG